jgi:hypothetical protein
MATVTPTTSEDDTATRRVRAYLRSLGVVDEIAVQRLADQLLASIPQNKDRSVRERLAMDAACGFKEVWYEAFSSCFDKDSPRHPDPLAGWRLWAIMRRQPEALLADPDVERINGIGEFGQGYAMPRVLEREMPSQPLGELPVALKKTFWQSVGLHTRRLGRTLTRHLRRK